MDNIFDKQFASKLKNEKNQPISDSMAKLTIIRAKYATDYMLFLRNMLKVYQKNSSINRELIGATKLVQTAIALLDTAMGKKGRPSTDEEAAMLKMKMDETNAQMQYFSKLYGESKRFKSVVDKIAQDTGLTLEHLTTVSADLLKEIVTITPDKESLGDMLKRTAPSVARLGENFQRDFMNQALGPFAPIGGMAWEAFTGIRRNVREQRTLRQRQRYAQAFGPMGMDVTGEAAESVRGRRGLGTGVGSVFEDARGGGATSFEGFFGQKAYQTKWTKEVVESLRKISGKKEDGSSDLLGNILKSDIVKYALMAVGGAAAIFGLGFAADKGLQSLMGGKNNYEKYLGKSGPLRQANIGMSLMGMTNAQANLATDLSMSLGKSLIGNVAQSPEDASVSVNKKSIKAGDVTLSDGSSNLHAGLGIIDAIENAFKNIGGKLSSVMNTMVVPKDRKESPYKAADPLIDDLNKTGS